MISTPFDKKAFQKIPPVFYAVIVLMAGIMLSFGNHFYWSIISIILSALSIVTISYYLGTYSKTIFILMLCFLAGFIRTTMLMNSYQSFHYPSKPIAIQGIVSNIAPTQQIGSSSCITLQMNTIYHDNHFQSTNHAIQIYTKQTNLSVADEILIKNITLKKNTNPDFSRYLIKEGILTTLFCHKLDFVILKHPARSLSRWIHSYKNHMIQNFQSKLSPQAFRLFTSLFLGIKDKKTTKQLNPQFKYWGITHFLARSGLHLVIVMAIYETLLRFFPLPFLLKHLLLALLGIIYFLLSLSSVSFLRAFAMFVYYKIATVANLQSHFLHILLMTCFIMLMINPLYLFFLDFQLSFGLTFSLGWLNLYRSFD